MKPGFIIMNQNPKDNPWYGDTHPLLPRKSSAGKLMLTLFLDMNGSILEPYQQKAETVSSVLTGPCWKRN
jgi:hypothetical protein